MVTAWRHAIGINTIGISSCKNFIIQYDEGMTKQTETAGTLVKKETLLIFTLAAFFAGFLCGVVFIVFKTTPSVPHPQQQSQLPAGGGSAADQTANLVALEKEVSLHPDNAAAWVEMGNIYFDSDQHPQAIKAYSKALELAPNNANVLTDLGVMYQRNHQPDLAISTFDKASQADPRHEPSRLNKAIVLMYDLHQHEAAIKALQDLLAMNPNAVGPNGMPVSEMLKTFQQQTEAETPPR